MSTTRSKLAASAAVVLLLAAAIAATVHSAFTDAVANEGNTFRTGTVDLRDDGVAGALFDLDGVRPGHRHARCLTLRYSSTGDIPSSVHMYGKTEGKLAEHLRFDIWRGSIPATVTGAERRACKGFVAEDAGAIYTSVLTDIPQAPEYAFRDPDDEWRDGDEAVYKVEVHVPDTNAIQGLTAKHAFLFEARSE